MKDNNKKYLKGSEWIKCDLHIHTPFSIENNYGDGSLDETWEEFISDLENLPKEFKILGINDYLFIDGYEKVLDYKNSGRLKNIDLLLPVIELRIDKFGTVSADNPFKRVNFHVIFSNELSPALIKGQFLDAINSEYKLVPDYLSNESDWGGVINKENLIYLGEKLIESSNGKLTGSPLTIGFQSLNVSYEDLIRKLQNPRLKNKYLTAVGKTEWDILRWESSPAEKKNVINKADFVFTASETVEAFNKAKLKLTSQNVNNLLLDCSDAHSLSNANGIKDRIGNCFTWVKINPTFRGLKYLTYEPDDRIFIGSKPEVEERVDANKTRYISKLNINQVVDYNESQGVWFKNQEVNLSKELTTIIGNKGKGKSAITDIIGLLGNSHNEQYFSFLNKQKFRKGNLARNFNATLEWESNISVTKNLAEHTDQSVEEKVKYLPQSYFEDLCNEIDNNQNFKKEINQVVFKHIDVTDRLGKNTFDEFIEEKKRNSEDTIKVLRDELFDINYDIVTLQQKDTENYKKGLESKINGLREDLKSHIDNKPKNPFPDETKKDHSKNDSSQNYKRLKVAEKELKDLLEREQEFLNNLENLNNDLIQLSQVRHRIESEEEQIKLFKEGERETLNSFDISIDEVFPSPVLNFVPIDELLKKKEKEKQLIQLHLGKIDYSIEEHKDLLKENEVLLFKQINVQKEAYDTISKSLDAKQKAKEDYNNSLINWEKVKSEIEGANENPRVGTLNYFKKELNYIKEELPTDISAKKSKRKVISEKIYDEKNKVIDIYSQLKSNIDNVLSANSDKIEEYKIALDASFQINNLMSNFLDFIDKARTGFFYGKEDAIKKFKELLELIDPNDKTSVIDFIEDLTDRLEENDGNKQNPFNQIKSSKNLQDLYDYVFGLKYLNEKYELKFANKSIEQLSPGERGAALIVFYLLLDNDDKPLIIDQPEDNLDNQSVYEILVPFIKQAKKKRQLIIVTHNPNLAVVSDAEQVIHVNIDKESNYTFSFSSGSIEEPKINKGIVDILEGTMPAFDKRKIKYLLNN